MRLSSALGLAGGFFLLPSNAGESLKPDTNEGCRTSIVSVFKHTLYGGCVMGELLRVGFVSLGALGIIGYLVYVALTEETFH